ncbi:hypothetical protein HF086_002609 [Spodoptera exigua]|uniref:Mitochondrial carrier protein n=1 Tax=Spodoptera exigua TaxID=7107 RepID=A0A922SBW6_SPOEX|nr:hypothetical protein HF086_002609 [Spodoptera exigua]
MVGYDKNDSMTSQEKLLAGCLSGVMTKCITQPMDVIKLRSQLLRKPKQRHVVYRVARRIFWEEGIRAFWHGHVLGQVHSVLAVSSQFFMYELATKWTSSLPIAQKTKNAITSMGPQAGISFAVFNFVQPLILSFFTVCPPNECSKGNKYKPQNIVLASSVAGSTAGFIAKSVTYPLDLAKRRLQFSVHLLLNFDVLYHGDRHVFVHWDRDVLDDRHLLDHRDFFHDRHVYWHMDFGDVVVVDGVHLVWHVDGDVLVAVIGNCWVRIMVEERTGLN